MIRLGVATGIVIGLALLFVEGALAAPPSSPAFAVIASADVPVPSLSRESTAYIYRRKQLFWRGGARVQPVNLPVAHPLRRSFSLCMLGQEPEAMENFWREMYFNGVFPPYVLDSETAIWLFVSKTPGAVGYVTSCRHETGVRVVLVVGDLPNCPKPTATCAALQD